MKKITLAELMNTPPKYLSQALWEGYTNIPFIMASYYNESQDQYNFLFRKLPFDEALEQSIELAKHYVNETILKTAYK